MKNNFFTENSKNNILISQCIELKLLKKENVMNPTFNLDLSLSVPQKDPIDNVSFVIKFF